MSSFGWLDYSEHERRRVLEVVELFGDSSTVDELGLGTIRDAFADLLFPGTSTIQTRAKYFLFVPWAYRQIEKRRINSADVARTARRLQDELRRVLMAGRDRDGVIGAVAGKRVQRLPDITYWSGLRRWGICRFTSSLADYHRSLDGFYSRVKSRPRADAAETADAEETNWDPSLPPSNGFPTSVNMPLTPAEADYLRDCILTRAGGSLLAWLIDRGARVPQEVAFAWDHPLVKDVPESLAVQLLHARHFSLVMHGSALLYNLILAEQVPKSDTKSELASKYRDRLAEWFDRMKAAEQDLQAWDRAAFWTLVIKTGANLRIPTRHFVDSWIDVAFAARSSHAIVESTDARQLITQRELQLKHGRARISNPNALEQWSGQAGIGQLDYRWNRPVKTIINDVLSPVREGQTHA